eukprot:5475446-Prymnesium_polylepis.2
MVALGARRNKVICDAVEELGEVQLRVELDEHAARKLLVPPRHEARLEGMRRHEAVALNEHRVQVRVADQLDDERPRAVQRERHRVPRRSDLVARIRAV